MDGAGPFCVSVPKHPEPVGGIVEVEAPDHGEVAPDLEPPVSPPAPHVEAQAVLYMIPGTEPIVAAQTRNAHYLRPDAGGGHPILLFAEIIRQITHEDASFAILFPANFHILGDAQGVTPPTPLFTPP